MTCALCLLCRHKKRDMIVDHFCVRFIFVSLQYESVDICGSVMILSFGTDMPGQTVQTQIRLLEQSCQGLHGLPFRLHRLDSMVQPG